jgi:hypothetical protein
MNDYPFTELGYTFEDDGKGNLVGNFYHRVWDLTDELRDRLHPGLRKLLRARLKTMIAESWEWSGSVWRDEVQKLADEMAEGYGKTGAQIVQALLDSLYCQPDYTAGEIRACVTEVAEEVPALKTILADARDDWTNDDWANAVIEVREGLKKEAADE